MADPWDTYFWQLDQSMLSFYGKIGLVQDEMYDLSVALTAEGNPQSGNQAYQMSTDQTTMAAVFYGGTYTFRNRLNVCLADLDSRISGIGGVTMASILDALLSATFEELQMFMGITDAYKSAIWDAPFNEDFYAALARGFRVWGT